MSIKWSDTARAAWGISSIIQTFPSCGWLVWLRYSPFSPGPIVTFVWRDQQGSSCAILGGDGQVHAAVTQVLSWAAVAACWNHSPLIPKNFHKPCLMFWFLSLLGKCKEFVVCLLEGFQNWAQNPCQPWKGLYEMSYVLLLHDVGLSVVSFLICVELHHLNLDGFGSLQSICYHS